MGVFACECGFRGCGNGGGFQARVCTLDGWQQVGTAATKREALALAEAACTTAGLDPECCAAARQIA